MRPPCSSPDAVPQEAEEAEPADALPFAAPRRVRRAKGSAPQQQSGALPEKVREREGATGLESTTPSPVGGGRGRGRAPAGLARPQLRDGRVGGKWLTLVEVQPDLRFARAAQRLRTHQDRKEITTGHRWLREMD